MKPQSSFALLIAACLAFTLGWFGIPLFAAEGETPEPSEPVVSAASDEGEKAILGFKKPDGIEIQLFAAEPMLANPVAFCIDSKGRFYVCETFRQSKGIEDNREHAEWLDEDLAAQTVEDRLAYLKRHLKDKLLDYTKHDDRIRLIEDTDGDGRADKATIFANHFNGILEGTGAGVLAYRGDVFYACIPKLWKMRDEDGDGVADSRTALHHGYGVRFAFRGHDMHGLIIGPDGKLYYSIGDRGYNVVTENGRLKDPESGAVFRCNLDGSDLEVVATGLRNPQELAFDDYGNLFAGDNNSDSGDRARWVYVVEGGDTGWRMAYQYLPDRGPFNREKIWHPQNKEQPAYIIPPVTNLADGPSGLVHYPGMGLSDHFKGRFMLCDFRGDPSRSGIRTFRVKPKGAFFEVVDEEQTFWNFLPTDLAFGPDGALYVSDWVTGWGGEGKGRIYKFFDPLTAASPELQELKKLLGGKINSLPNEQLAALLAHADRRVRQEAQFALVQRGELRRLAKVAHFSGNQLARLHAIWGLGQIGRRGDSLALAPVNALLGDDDSEVRSQAAKTLGEAKYAPAQNKLTTLLQDENARVRFFAAVSLGKLGSSKSVGPLLKMLAENSDQDPVLRHGGVMGLAGCGTTESLLAAARHSSPAARMGVLLAMRKRKMPQAALFLNDLDERLVVEAARAIHDLPLLKVMPQLASLINSSKQSDPLTRRVLNANYRLGQARHAAAVASFAARSDASEAMRLEALAMLATWETPSGRDRVLGMWRPLPQREASLAATAMRDSLPGILSGPEKIAVEGAKTAARLGITEVAPALQNLLADASQKSSVRAAALKALAGLKEISLDETLSKALEDDQPLVRSAARNVLAHRDPEKAIPFLRAAAFNGQRIERQTAWADLGQIKSQQSEAILSEGLEKLLAGVISNDTTLDLLEAAAAKKSPAIKEQLALYDALRDKKDLLSPYRELLEGGDPQRGRKIFFERLAVSCVRCHKIGGVGGEVGPDLSKIATEKKRAYLLEAIVDPNRTIAKNFESVMLVDEDGKVHSGVVKSEDKNHLRLITAQGEIVEIPQESIEDRKQGKSPMPEDLLKLISRFEARDLVAFLSSLK